MRANLALIKKQDLHSSKLGGCTKTKVNLKCSNPPEMATFMLLLRPDAHCMILQ